MANEREFVIYISSTLDDLEAERKTAERIASRHGRVLTTTRADSVPVVQTCIDDVRSCDAYVGIIGMRYGWQPADISINPDDKSITELEYDACGDQTRRLVFIKDGPVRPYPPHQDDDTSRIKAFRERLRQGLEHTAFPFDDEDEDEQKHFALKLEQSLAQAKQKFQLTWGGVGGAMGGSGRPRKDLLQSVALLGIEGDDDAAIATAKEVGGANFSCATLRLDDVDLWREIDRKLRVGQSACLLLTAPGLSRLKADPDPDRMATWLRDAQECARPLTLALAGVEAGDLPASWQDGLCVAVPAPPWTGQSARAVLDTLIRAIDGRVPAIRPTGSAERDTLHRQWYAMATRRSGLDKVSLPVVIVAPNLDEMNSLVGAERAGFAGYENEFVRGLRVSEFVRLERIPQQRAAGWPGNSYGDNRSLWRCFGPNHPAALALVLAAIRSINEATVGSRERRLLPRTLVVPRLYRFDDLVEADPGRVAALVDACSAGSMVVVDEFALLHPRLLRAAKPLLDLPRTATVSISASDPIHSRTEELLDGASFLRVGQFIQRYEIERDPRCEVAVNSMQRLERWIRLVVPEMLALGDAGEASPDLVRNSPQLFAPTAGLS